MPSSPAPARLAVVIVSYNVRDLLRACLHSVLASARRSQDWLQVEITVVDNASRDGTPAMVAAEFPQVRLWALDENLGFTRANNLVLREWMGEGSLRGNRETDGAGRETGDRGSEIGKPRSAPEDRPRSATPQSPDPPIPPPPSPPDFVLLLNPDTEVLDDALGQMVAFLRAHPQVGACGAQLRYPDGRFQHGAFRFPGPAQVALDILPLAQVPGLRRFLPTLLDSRLNGRYPKALWQRGAPFPVDFVLGAALMVRTEAIRAVGLLDEGYFMYCEEMDWCLRLRQAGWDVYALPQARVIHHEGASSRPVRWPSFVHLWRSRRRFYTRHAHHFPPGTLPAVRALLRVGLAWRRALAWRRFAQGQVDGQALAVELDAYQAVARAWDL